MTGVKRKAWILMVAMLFALLAGPALALGLGQIEIKSQRGEPLLAEIPIISSDPAELDNLQARLASPETFARIGLQPPRGIVSDLQFTVALSASGDPVIRVTSHQPVDEAVLTFLLEVDWGQGRLVREYSVLVDAPRTVAAPAQPPISAPEVAPSNTIVREPLPAPAPPPVATEAGETAKPVADAGTPQVADQANEAAPADNAIPSPAPAPAAPPPPPAPVVRAAAAPVSASPGEYGPVKAGDTLGSIARTLDTGHTLDQTMLALLRANPDAFIKGNVNLIKRGAVLRVPQAEALSEYTAAEARAIVHEQIGQWRAMRQPVVQPAAIAGANATGSKPDGSNDNGSRVVDARLAIVPPSADGGQKAGNKSGTTAGGEGDMLRQELIQTKETLAARDAEVQELKTRVAELEKLQQDQQQLIALKDSKLAQAQQNLATSNKAQSADTTAQVKAAEPAPATGGPILWPWLIVVVVVVLLLAWLFMRRKAPPARRPVFDTAALAAASTTHEGSQAADTSDGLEPFEDEEFFEDETGDVVAADTGAGYEAFREAEDSGSDRSRSDDIIAAQLAEAASAPDPVTTSTHTPALAPTWHAGAAVSADSMPSLNPAPAGHARLELARAYLDLGDTDTARSLLQEVADGGDAAARGEAARLLRELV